jgi:hypothetical protein
VTDHITQAEFAKQFPNLVLSARDLPRKPLPFHVLLVSTILPLDPDRAYSEAEINAELQRWILQFGGCFKLEHAELRRYLVDEGYLSRDPAGLAYEVKPDAGQFTFDPALRQLDLAALVAEAEADRQRRKQAHMGGEGTPSSGGSH